MERIRALRRVRPVAHFAERSPPRCGEFAEKLLTCIV